MAKRQRGIQGEIGQRRPFVSRAQETTIALLRTADVVRRDLAAVSEPYGLTFQQYNVLRILRGARPEPLATLEIRERMIERMPGVTRFVDHLEREGLVRRERDETDRRRVNCWITDAGLALLAEIDDAMDEADDRAVSGLTTGQMKTLISLLQLVRDSAGE